MSEINLHHAAEITREAVVAAGAKLKPHFGNVASLAKGSEGGVGGIVTELDRQTEIFLAKELGKFSRSIGFEGEEFGVQSAAETTWLVDPIDGTSHFIRGLPFCTTMVALVQNGEVVVSVINDFVNDNTYWAIRDGGAFCNDTPIAVSQRPLKEGIVSFEARIEKPAITAKYLAVREQVNIASTLNSGFEFAMVASGKFDGRIGLDPYGFDWDYAPGSLLATEAGGKATNIGRTTYDFRDHDYIIANPRIHAELTEGDGAIFPVIP